MTFLDLAVRLTFDGTALDDPDGLLFDRLVRGGPGTTALVRGADDIIAGAEGRFPRNRVKDIRTIEAVGYVTGTGATAALAVSDYWANRIAAATLFDPTAFGVLEAVLPNGQTYTINARPLPGFPSYGEVNAHHATASVEFESLDPDWVAS